MNLHPCVGRQATAKPNRQGAPRRAVLLVLGLAGILSGQDPARRGADLDREVEKSFRLGQYAEAERYQKQALQFWEEAARSQQISLAASHANLAQIFLALGKLSAAEQEARRALELLQAEGPRAFSSPNAASVRSVLAVIEFRSGRHAEAEQQQQEVVASLEPRESDHPVQLARALNELANIRAARGDRAGARILLERSVAILRRTGSTNDPDFGRLLSNLALLSLQQGDLVCAGSLYLEAVAVLESTLGPDHLHTGMVLAEYAQLLRKTGSKSEARQVERRAARALASSRDSRERHTVDVRALARR